MPMMVSINIENKKFWVKKIYHWLKKLIGFERDIVIADVLSHFEIWSKESWYEELLKLTADLEAKQWD